MGSSMSGLVSGGAGSGGGCMFGTTPGSMGKRVGRGIFGSFLFSMIERPGKSDSSKIMSWDIMVCLMRGSRQHHPL